MRGGQGEAKQSESVEGVLLTRQWFDRAQGVELQLWAASSRGPLKLRFTRREVVMFIERSLPEVGGRRQPVELANLDGRPLDALYFRSQRELRQERQRIRAAGGRTFEGTLNPHDRFLMERFITGSFTLEGPALQRRGYLEFVDPNIASCEYSQALSSMAFDIETAGLEGALLSIAVAGAGGERVWIVGERDTAEGAGADPERAHEGAHERGYELLPSEAAVLRAFLAHVAAADPDILVGWNVVEFDLAYLERKAVQLGVPFTLGRGGERAKVLAPRRPRQPHVARVPGRVVLDGIATLRAATFAFESFRLEEVARSLLGRGKNIDEGKDPVAEILRLHAEDKRALAAYNLEDCRLVLDIFAHADLVGFASERQALTGLPMDRQGGSTAAFDNLYLPRMHRKGYAAPDLDDVMDFVPSPGGWIMDSEPGLYENVLVLDFKSLYPSIIRTFAVDPLGLALAKLDDDPIPGFEGASFARRGHILPGLIEGLWTAREAAKARGDAARSRAIKILMNSFYGVLGSGGCRFFNPKLASSITRRGHEIIQRSRARIEARGLEVIYGDTDSVFVHVGSEAPEACARIGSELAAELTAYWREELDARYGISSQLELEFETHYRRFFMPTMRGSDKGSKKRYAGTLGAGEEARLVIKGLEAVRTDWTPLARSFQRELLARVFADAPWRGWMTELARALRAGELDEQLVYRKRIRRGLDEYLRNVPPHIQAARKLGRPVREIRYVITTRGPEPVDIDHARIDYDHYLTRQLAPAADGILRFLGTRFSSIAGQQLSLFE